MSRCPKPLSNLDWEICSFIFFGGAGFLERGRVWMQTKSDSLESIVQVFLKVASGDHGNKKEQEETDSWIRYSILTYFDPIPTFVQSSAAFLDP